MKKDTLISMWEEGSDRIFTNEKTDKEMITKYLNEKTLKGSRSLHFNLVFYGLIQVANIILLSMNLVGYSTNQAMIWILVSLQAINLGILFFTIDVFYKLREINNYSDSLQSLINKQLRFYRRPYEIWLILSSVSVIILMTNLNLFIDNDHGTYVINNKILVICIILGALLFVYGALKIASLFGFKQLRAYLFDLQQGVLDKTKSLERSKRQYQWILIVVFILLSASLVFGILKAVN